MCVRRLRNRPRLSTLSRARRRRPAECPGARGRRPPASAPFRRRGSAAARRGAPLRADGACRAEPRRRGRRGEGSNPSPTRRWWSARRPSRGRRRLSREGRGRSSAGIAAGRPALVWLEAPGSSAGLGPRRAVTADHSRVRGPRGCAWQPTAGGGRPRPGASTEGQRAMRSPVTQATSAAQRASGPIQRTAQRSAPVGTARTSMTW